MNVYQNKYAEQFGVIQKTSKTGRWQKLASDALTMAILAAFVMVCVHTMIRSAEQEAVLKERQRIVDGMTRDKTMQERYLRQMELIGKGK